MVRSYNRCALTAFLAALVVGQSVSMPRAAAQFGGGFGFQNRSVGGVAVDAQGVLEAPTVDDQRQLDELRAKVDSTIPKDLERFVELRAVSLKQLEAALASAKASGQPVADEVRYLAGLQRVRYVFVYPDQHDVVIAGPAEGWKIDALGNVVGATTHRPVLLLEDLIVALRSGGPSRTEAITCSIDPTSEGLQQMQAVMSRMKTMGDPDQTMAAVEDALGPQTISVTGVPADSHFARTMVAADFRMKRLAMNFDPAPVDGMPSFMHMISRVGRAANNMMPRWWLATNYEPLAKSKDGLAWELRGPGVKCLTEQQYLSDAGQKEKSARPNGQATQWAQTMTDRYDDLAEHDSSFGQLRNIMDLAVIGALVEREQLAAAAGLTAPQLMGEAQLASYPVPRSTSSKASVLKSGRNWIISASGGVELLPWNVAEKSETVDSLSGERTKLAANHATLWSE